MSVADSPLRTRPVLLVPAGLLLLSMLGCGMSSMPMAAKQPSSSSPAAQSAVQVRIGDAPADRVLSFEITLGPITLTASDGSMVTLLSDPTPLELSHLSATNELLSTLHIPQGSYTAGSITVSNPEIVFIDNNGARQRIEPAFNQAIAVTFNPPLSVSPSATVLSIDLNIAKALTFDSQGNVTGLNLSPASFTFGSAAVGPESGQDDHDGKVEGITGVISAVNGPSFDLLVDGTGFTLTFVTDGDTQFDDGAALTVNTRVSVEGFTRTDGTLYAHELDLVAQQQNNQQEADADGLITQVTGAPATQLSFFADDGGGNGMGSSQIGSTVTVDVTNARYRVHSQDMDTSGVGSLPSPQFPFDAGTIHAGQRVQVNTSGGGMHDDVVANDDGGGGNDGGNQGNDGGDNGNNGGNNGNDGGDNGNNGGNQGNNGGNNGDNGGNNGNNNGHAARVELLPQTLFGTVSGLSALASAEPVTFTLTVPSDSVFATLSGQTTVTVFVQPGTDLQNLATLTNGNTVRVRGLVFFNGKGFTMIAGRMTH